MMDDNKRYDTPKDPIRNVLKQLCGVTPPPFIRGIDYRGLTDEQWDAFHQWAVNHARPYWTTGNGMMDAALVIVADAISNGNIRDNGLGDVQFGRYSGAHDALETWREKRKGRAYHLHVTAKRVQLSLGKRGKCVADVTAPNIHDAVARVVHQAESKKA